MHMANIARVGSRVEFRIPNGLDLVNGRAVQSYKTVQGKVHIVTSTHLVCSVGKRFGNPYCVDTYKLIKY